MAKNLAERMKVKLRELLPGWTSENWPTFGEFLEETRMRIDVSPSHYYTVRKSVIQELGLDNANRGSLQNIAAANSTADDKVMENLQRRAASLANLMKTAGLEEVTVVKNVEGGFDVEYQHAPPPRAKLTLEN